MDWDGDGEPIPDGGEVISQPKDVHSPGSGLDEIHELLFCALGELPAMRNPDGRVGIPKRGIKPWLARMWANQAALDKRDLMTEISVEDLDLDLPSTGYDEMLMLDPESDGAKHIAADLERRAPILHRFDLEAEEADWSTKLAALGGAALLVAGVPGAGFAIGAQYGVPMLGGALGILPALVESYGATDGDLEYDAAEQHFQDAWGTLADLQREQSDARTVKGALEERDRERLRTAQEVLERSEQTDETMASEVIREVVNVPLDHDDEVRENGHETPAPDAGAGEEGNGDE